MSPHWLRHAHCSHALDRGANPALVRDTAGHADLRSDQRLFACPAERKLVTISGGLKCCGSAEGPATLQLPDDPNIDRPQVGQREPENGYFLLGELVALLQRLFEGGCRTPLSSAASSTMNSKAQEQGQNTGTRFQPNRLFSERWP